MSVSLQLLEGYSSAEDDDDDPSVAAVLSDSDDLAESDDASPAPKPAAKPRRGPNPSRGGGGGDALLPSALEAFDGVSGPPDFLAHAAAAPEEKPEVLGVLAGGDRRRDRTQPPPGAVVQAKPQLIGVHERVRSDVGGNNSPGSVTAGSVERKRLITATNPGPEDAADLLRMCLQCGIPKTFSHGRGMVCPVCGDRPAETNETEKKGSTVKDKEKVKRMRGQSSHATWKSETEMVLRQQFD